MIRLFLLALESFGRNDVYIRVDTPLWGLIESGFNIELAEDEATLGVVSNQDMDRLLRYDWCCSVSPSVSLGETLHNHFSHLWTSHSALVVLPSEQ